MKRISVFLITFLIVISIFTNCFATNVSVTKENLIDALEGFTSSSANDGNYEIEVSDDVITITVDGESYELAYDLTDKPTFSYELPIQKGMTYDEYNEKINDMILPMVGYFAVANIEGADFEDISTYMLKILLNSSTMEENSYIIVDDTVPGFSGEKDEDNDNIIYVSEFGDRVIEYVTALYKEKIVFSDTEEGIDSFEWVTEQKDLDDESCVISSKLTVDTTADFSKIKEASEDFENEFLDPNITKDNADYVIDLKVGQKCRIIADDKFTGHAYTGSGFDFNTIDDYTLEIIGESKGKVNGTVSIGETVKTFYITIGENTDNEELQDAVIMINTKTSSDKTDDEKDKTQDTDKDKETPGKNDDTPKKDDTTVKNPLPQTGLSYAMYLGIAITLVVAVFYGVKLKKYRDIK